ncbi:reverse transcriptase domain-containing protein, partial [Tanacetum coccineum]
MRTELKKEMDNTLTRQNNAFKNELKNKLTNDIKNMMSCFFQMNTASSSGSNSLPGNTVANPRGDLKAITTRSGNSYDGHPIPPPLSPLPKVVKREPEVTKDTVQPSTENIQPLVVQIQAPIDVPVVAPKPKPSIPYPSRANKQKLREKDDNLASKFPWPIWVQASTLCLFSYGRSFPDLTSTRMTLELTDRSITRSIGVAEDVFVKVGKFHFLADFVVVDYVVDPRVPLILGRPFLRTARALIDVYGEELTLRVDDEAITFKVGQTSRYSYNNAKSVNRIDVIDVSCEEYAQEVLEGDFILEEIEACLTNDSIPPGIDDADFDPKGDLLLLEKLLNDDPSSPLPPKELHIEEMKTIKSSIDDPPKLELKDLPSHLEYTFLEGTDKLPVIISKELKDEEKAALLKTKRRPSSLDLMGCLPTNVCLLVYGMLRARSKDKMLKRCEDTNLVLNWEKCHFMVKEGIVLGYKISKSGIEVDRAKVDVIAKLPHPTSVKEFDVIIRDKKGAENLAADHLSRLENPHQGDLEKKEINETFPLETIGIISSHNDSSTP